MDIKERLSENSIYIAFILLVIFNIIVTPNFADVMTFWNLIIYSTNILLIAMGMNLIIATGGIDISVGSTMAFSGILLSVLTPIIGIFPAVIISLLVGGITGIIIGWIIVKFDLQPIIVTLAMMIAIRGVAQITTSGALITWSENPLSKFVYYRIGGIVPVQFIIFIIVGYIFYIFVEKTIWGRYIEAVGDNKEAAHIMGIDIKRIKIIVYCIAGAMAGLAGILETARLKAANPNTMGQLIELDAIAAVAVGGTFMSGGKPKILHTIIGLLIMQLITMMVNMNNIKYSYSLVLKTLIIILAVYLQKKKQ